MALGVLQIQPTLNFEFVITLVSNKFIIEIYSKQEET